MVDVPTSSPLAASGEQDPSTPPWRRSWLHPQALYLDERWGGGEPPPPSGDLLRGVRRLRAVLPAGASAPPGWSPVKATVLLRVPVAALAASLPPLPAGLRLRPLPLRGPALAPWLALHARRYRSAHRSNPPRVLGVAGRAEVFGGDDLLLALGLCRDGRLSGFASLRRGAARSAAEAGWLGAEEPGAAQACAWLLGRCAREARRMGLRWIEVEIDGDHPQLAPLLRQLPRGERHEFLTWEQRIVVPQP